MPQHRSPDPDLDTERASSRYSFITPTLLVLTGAFVWLQAYRFPLTPYFYENDALIFCYDAARMLHGDIIYRDFFQFTMPGTQLIYLALFRVFGEFYWTVGVVVIVASACLAGLSLAISKRIIGGPLAYLPPVFFIFFGLRWFGVDGSHRMISPVFMLAAILIVIGGMNVFRAIAAGASCAAASFFTQPRGLVVLAACVAFILIDSWMKNENWRRSISFILLTIASFVISLAVLCSYFIAQAGFANFFYSTVVHPSIYYPLHPDNTFWVFFTELRKAMNFEGLGRELAALAAVIYAIVLPLITASFFIYFALKNKTKHWSYWRTPFFVALAAAFFFVGTSAPMQLRLYSVSAPSLVLAFWWLSQLKLIRNNAQSFALGLSALLIAAGFIQAIAFQIRAQTSTAELPAGPVAVVEPNPQFGRFLWLRDRTQPGDFVYEVYEPFVNFPLHLRNPSRIGQVFPYAYTPREQVMEVISDLEQNRPRFIVWDNSYIKPDIQRSAGDNTGPIAEFVADRYRPASPIYMIGDHPVQVWEIK